MAQYGRCLNGDVSGRGWSSGRFRFQSSDLVELHNKSCRFVIFTGCTVVTKGTSNSDDFFNVSNVLFSMVDGFADSGDSGNNGSVGIDIM